MHIEFDTRNSDFAVRIEGTEAKADFTEYFRQASVRNALMMLN